MRKTLIEFKSNSDRIVAIDPSLIRCIKDEITCCYIYQYGVSDGIYVKGTYNEVDEPKTIDKHWAKENANLIRGKVRESIRMVDHEEEIEGPLTLLNDALKKLYHKDMDPDILANDMNDEALKKTKEIQLRAIELEKEFWERKQKLKKLANKK